LRVFVEGMDVVAKKSRFLAPRMRNERLSFGEFQFELIAQELSQQPFDFFRL